MNNTKVDFSKRYLIHEKNSDMWVSMKYLKYFLIAKDDGRHYDLVHVKDALINIAEHHPTWKCEVIEQVTETIEYEQVIEVNLEDED